MSQSNKTGRNKAKSNKTRSNKKQRRAGKNKPPGLKRSPYGWGEEPLRTGQEVTYTDTHGDITFETTIRPVTGPVDQAIRDFKQRIYGQWLEDPDSALGYLTPREAVKNENRRADVVRMLDEFERLDREQSTPDLYYDFDGLRRELGLL
jgi:hypothetical protein